MWITDLFIDHKYSPVDDVCVPLPAIRMVFPHTISRYSHLSLERRPPARVSACVVPLRTIWMRGGIYKQSDITRKVYYMKKLNRWKQKLLVQAKTPPQSYDEEQYVRSEALPRVGVRVYGGAVCAACLKVWTVQSQHAVIYVQSYLDRASQRWEKWWWYIY